MHIIPKFKINTDPNAESFTEYKKKNIDFIEQLVWNEHKDFKKQYGIPLGMITLELQEEKINTIRLFCEEPLND